MHRLSLMSPVVIRGDLVIDPALAISVRNIVTPTIPVSTKRYVAYQAGAQPRAVA